MSSSVDSIVAKSSTRVGVSSTLTVNEIFPSSSYAISSTTKGDDTIVHERMDGVVALVIDVTLPLPGNGSPSLSVTAPLELTFGVARNRL